MKKQSRTDWSRIDALKDSEIDYSDIPPITEEFFRDAILWPGTKEQVTLRLDPDVLGFFRAQGRGYQTAINSVLRKYVDARKRETQARRSRKSR